MTVTIVVMILLGIAFVIASFIVTEKLTKKEDNYNIDLMAIDEDYRFSERELQIIKRKIEDVIAKQAKDILYETNESLSNMANEKTMALGDYAVAVCDEIEKNHKEVMFLYSMLDDKQKEIMRTVQDVNGVKNEVKEEIKNLESIKAQSYETPAYNEPVYKEPEPKTTSSLTEELEALAVNDNYNDADIPSEDNSSFADLADLDNADSSMDDIFAEIDKADIDFDEVLENDFKDDGNANDIILEMYHNGRSVIEIAKELGLGVGEVKLVIDLYQGE